eukprot:363917-Chlamydomonas_euryale.AAC.2
MSLTRTLTLTSTGTRAASLRHCLTRSAAGAAVARPRHRPRRSAPSLLDLFCGRRGSRPSPPPPTPHRSVIA